MIITGFEPLKGIFTTTEGDILIKDTFPILLGTKHPVHRVFDPCSACRGKCLKDRKDCFEPHVVYIALFGKKVKIGATKERRFPCRLKEQGADAGISIAHVDDGEKARKLEQEYSMKLGITDRISLDDIVNAITGFELSILERYAGMFGSETLYVIDYLSGKEINNPIKITPKTGLRIGGRVTGNRGKIVFLRRGDVYYWINGEELTGFEIFPTSKYDIQTSLGEW